MFKHAILLVLALLALTGCGMFRSDSKTQTHELTQVSGTVDGKVINLTLEKNGESSKQTEVGLSDKLMAWVQMAIAAVSGPTGLLATAATMYSLSKRNENKQLLTQVEYHKSDSSEGWNKYSSAMES